jgi:hypothetical protein
VVTLEIADAQRRQAGLARAEEVARPSQLEVTFRDDEAVGRLYQRVEPRTAASPSGG